MIYFNNYWFFYLFFKVVGDIMWNNKCENVVKGYVGGNYYCLSVGLRYKNIIISNNYEFLKL